MSKQWCNWYARKRRQDRIYGVITVAVILAGYAVGFVCLSHAAWGVP